MLVNTSFMLWQPKQSLQIILDNYFCQNWSYYCFGNALVLIILKIMFPLNLNTKNSCFYRLWIYGDITLSMPAVQSKLNVSYFYSMNKLKFHLFRFYVAEETYRKQKIKNFLETLSAHHTTNVKKVQVHSMQQVPTKQPLTSNYPGKGQV